MTTAQIDRVFGFPFDDFSADDETQWTFRVDGQTGHGSLLIYVGKFESDRLKDGALWSAPY